ncbi:hypothetical protein ACH41H_49480 [Streptomyces sp. NPDC020800]|uniref:hypothetical protein n=1 Tax=Streptomyces sp. NPDC020800 TaxID=3365092 RepID=UPI0037B2048F
MATQSLLPDTSVGGGDYLYAPTAKAPGGSCIELTTAYSAKEPLLWAWDWCGSVSPGKTVRVDSDFLTTYTTTVEGRPAYTFAEALTDARTNAWSVYLYNYARESWDTFYSSSGKDKSNFDFGWDTYEVYTTTNPATGNGYICDATHGTTIESSGIRLYTSAWVPATPEVAPLSSSPPSGAAFRCPALRLGVRSPDDDWIAVNQ